MKQRIVTGILFGAVLLAALLWRDWALFPALEVVCVLCCVELLRAFEHKGLKPAHWLCLVCAALPLPALWLFGGRVAVAVSGLSLFAVLLCLLFRREPSLPDAAASLCATGYVSLPLMLLLSLARVEPRALSGLLLCGAFLFAYAGDVCAYFTGSLLGRHKMTPVLSPKKTWEGAAGGLAGSLLMGVILWFVGNRLSLVQPLWHYLPLALVCGVAGQAGDLFASLIKRWCGIKDYGNLFPGHGGMLDRIDSVLFTSVVLHAYCLITGLL